MMDYRKLSNRVTESVAQALNQHEEQDKIDFNNCKAKDFELLYERARIKYFHDAMFHARVDTLVAQIMSIIREEMGDL